MKLVALRCPACARPLAPHDQDVVTVCAGCREAVHLAQQGVALADVLYAEPAAGAEPGHWLPFWIFYGEVDLQRRLTQEGSSGRNLTRALGSALNIVDGRTPEEVARAFWAEPRRFYIPAWEISLQTAREVGGGLLAAQPRYRAQPRPEAAALLPARLRAEDAEKMIEFIVLDLEVRRDDWLRDIAFTVQVDAPALWAVPAVRAGQGWRLVTAGANSG